MPSPRPSIVESGYAEHGHVVDARDEVQRGERRHHARAPDQNGHTGGDERTEGEDQMITANGKAYFSASFTSSLLASSRSW